jgi:predicted RNase H-like HicB family nuclease
MTVSTEDLADQPYAVEITPEEQPDGSIVFMASHPELPGCLAHGVTAADALADLLEATSLYISALVARGLDVPPPAVRRVN